MGSVVNCALTLFNSKKDSKAQFAFEAKEPEKLTAAVTEVEGPKKKFNKLPEIFDKLRLRSPKTVPGLNPECFMPGKYSYDFEMILHSGLPESTFIEGTIVRYHLKASVTCHSMLRGMYKSIEVDAVRCPTNAYVEDSVGGNWALHVDRVLHADIHLRRKGIALEDHLPGSFKYKGYNNTKFRKLQVFLVEDVRYFMRDGTQAGKAPYKKLLIYENSGHRPDVHPQQEEVSEEELNIFEATSTRVPLSSTNSDTPDGDAFPPSETMGFDFELDMPKCISHRGAPDFRYMHYDTKIRSVMVSHFFQFHVHVFINGRPAREPFERLVPLTLRSCYASDGNTTLPTYCEEDLPVYSLLFPNAPASTIDYDR
ncbi:hypothetical protein V6Z96_000431 [Aspergillus fumigatus]